MIAALRPILREMSILYFTRALREINPLHRDVPLIVLTLHRLELERRA